MKYTKGLAESKSVVRKFLIVTTLMIGLVLVYAMLIEPNWIEIKEQPVFISNLPDSFEGFRIVQLSDLHGKSFPRQEIAHKIKKLKPDILAITGDIFDQSEDIPLQYTAMVLDGLTAKYGAYFVFGNNEVYLDEQKIIDELARIKIKTLINENVRLTLGGDSIDIVGVADPYTQDWDLLKALEGTGPEPKILLAHTPEIIYEAFKAGIDLTLVGHTHGGQIFIPFAPKLTANVSKGYEQFRSGLHKVGGSQMYVNRGLGENGIKMRFLSRPEITLITLYGK